ncbi:hypothetical protein Glove_262g64 [Diversispora epigaea]|uniref:Uncharacterized protein n=1 Tax=Diversispora epigaea TaxID=1348612 RepID=A0A397IE44_9GLOM|nr:hypothetical protein Glove_262g64 [Diversispora epigaea]
MERPICPVVTGLQVLLNQNANDTKHVKRIPFLIVKKTHYGEGNSVQLYLVHPTGVARVVAQKIDSKTIHSTFQIIPRGNKQELLQTDDCRNIK